MRLINRWTQAAYYRRLWLEQYGKKREMHQLAQDIEACGPRPNPEEIRKVSGSRISVSDTYRCDECDQLADELVELGEQPNFESSTAQVCRSCLLKALQLTDE